MNRRTIERVMTAASNTKVDTYRESAVIGGIVQCLLITGHFDHFLVAKYANANIKAYQNTTIPDARALIGNFGPVTGPEVARASRAFQRQYDPPSEGVAA